ncbi:MAG: hypothetical protein KGZ97_03665 [Bacteroidetes bacterium]|nr:hypothetical protein [Bacteroidota bacterium]
MRVTLFLILLLTVFSLSSQTSKEILPNSGWQEGWQKGEVQFYKGDDLFFLINGGADLYMEYGFVDVAAADYVHSSLGKLYVEIYKMENEKAAFGIFSMSKASSLVKIAPSPWIIMADKFLHIWKGSYYITISGADFNKAGFSIDYLMLMSLITDKIKEENILPETFTKYEKEGCIYDFAYIMGPLALNNVYSFGFQDIFNVESAVMIDTGVVKIIEFEYSNVQKCEETYRNVSDFMMRTNRFSSYSSEDNTLFSVTDRNGKILIISLKENRIIVEIS